MGKKKKASRDKKATLKVIDQKAASKSVEDAIKAVEQQAPKNKQKIKLLYHGDSPKVNTGFGVVAREILGRLYATGKYEIYCLGINDRGDTSSHFEAPGIHHFALPDLQRDPYGIGRMPEIIKSVKPDVIFTLNDIWVLGGTESQGSKNWFLSTIRQLCPHVPWILYFPVDSRPWAQEWVDLAFSADKTIVYSNYAVEVLNEISPDKKPILIPHGVSLERFKILEDEVRNASRNEMGIQEDEFLVGFISRNQPRKNAAAAIEIFNMANDGYRKCTCGAIRQLGDPKCEYCGDANENVETIEGPMKGKAKMYMHCNMQDPMGTDLYKVMDDNSVVGENFIFRPDHHIALGLPDGEFTKVLNCLDVHFFPTMAEGFGLTVIETMACGVPNIATRSTAVTEQIEEGRGWIVNPLGHMIFDDAANTRKHIIDPERAVMALKEAFEDWEVRGDSRWGPRATEMKDKGLEFCKANNWDDVGKRFDEEIEDALESRVSIPDQFSLIDEEKPPQDQPRYLAIRNGTAGDILQTIPALKGLSEQTELGEIVYAIPSNLVKVFEGRYPFIKKFIPQEKLSDKGHKLNTRVATVGFDGIVERYEQGAYPYIDRSDAELYLMNAQQDSSNVSLAGYYTLTDEEISRGKELFVRSIPDYDSSKDFVVGISPLAECRRASWGDGPENWDTLKSYLEKVGIKVFMLSQGDHVMDNLAAFTLCDMVVTPDSAILDFLHALEIPTLTIISPFRLYRIKGFLNCIPVIHNEFAKTGSIEDPNPNIKSHFIDGLGHGDIFTPLLMAFKEWKKEMEKIEEATVEA